jgi:hypothetical protein
MHFVWKLAKSRIKRYRILYNTHLPATNTVTSGSPLVRSVETKNLYVPLYWIVTFFKINVEGLVIVNGPGEY